ncbi:MAG TPA: TlpA family protein disulfide reductase [Bacteroidetes bacterium]|nr:TlpA family protein disulfide reductase [Bacteroidota bacterium]
MCASGKIPGIFCRTGAVLLFLTVFAWPGRAQEPDIPVFDFSGIRPFLEQTDDTTYLINFWATWCTPCVEEMPAINEIARKYRDRKLSILLVSLDFPTHIETRVIPFIREHRLIPRVVVLDDPDADRWIREVSSRWSGAIPATLIYRNEKRDFYEKSFTYQELETIVKLKLDQP